MTAPLSTKFSDGSRCQQTFFGVRFAVFTFHSKVLYLNLTAHRTTYEYQLSKNLQNHLQWTIWCALKKQVLYWVPLYSWICWSAVLIMAHEVCKRSNLFSLVMRGRAVNCISSWSHNELICCYIYLPRQVASLNLLPVWRRAHFRLFYLLILWACARYLVWPVLRMNKWILIIYLNWYLTSCVKCFNECVGWVNWPLICMASIERVACKNKWDLHNSI